MVIDFATIPSYYHQCPDLTGDDDLPRMHIGDCILRGHLPEGKRGHATSYVCPRCHGVIWIHVKGTES